MKIIKIPVGFLYTNCYLLFDEKTLDAIVIDPGEEPDKILTAIDKYHLKIYAVINTHAHFDHTGGNEKVCGTTKTKIFAPSKDGEEKQFGSLKIKFLFTPGHTDDGISILAGNHIFCGDTLFEGSVGRTDLGGNMKQLLNSIKTKLMSLPSDTYVHPGHGPDTTIGREKISNPFLR
ncbi:MAG: putative metallo-hydrolase [Elusimicrobia bacterium ADurb.Bin231]|nr:MAG: putative metallo-hydrolase [Elusimicrobia bacterium ADurb.Bin231]